jgi:sulfonate transport system permease protein
MTSKTMRFAQLLGAPTLVGLERAAVEWRLSSVNAALTCVLPATLFAVWYVVTRQQLVSPQLIVPPAAALSTLVELWTSGELLRHVSSSLARLMTGFSIGTISGLLLGVTLGSRPRFASYFLPTFQLARQLPTIALIPFFILVFGVEETFKVLLVTKACFFIVALAALDATRNISRKYFEVAAIYSVPRLTVLRSLVLPAITPAVIAGIRLSLGRSWMVLVAAELMAADAGVGQMMEMGRQLFRMDVVVVGVFLTGSIGLLLDVAVRLLERRLTKWKPESA